MRIRNAPWLHNLRYQWHKVRTATGIDGFREHDGHQVIPILQTM